MTNVILNMADYRQKVLGCWLGKNIGGTLGAPFEWKRQLNDVSFYTQELGGVPLPNDDLDIQLLWLIALEECGLDLNARTLADYWCLYVTPHWSEYGTAKVNMQAGLPPPLSGSYHNAYKDSCGAFIRSEIWACLCPGNPRRAARYAYNDAILDHGDGEGTHAEVFCAAMEAAAFVLSDLRALVEIGLSYIPAESGCTRAVRFACEAFDAGQTWQEARDGLLQQFRGETFFGMDDWTSTRDHEKGFTDGQRGWDAPANLGITALALLYGEGDFARTLCTAVNCGEDTDCTAATAGALFGILHGADAIPAEWIAPIGRGIKTACLNLGELGFYGDQLPQTVDELTERTLKLGSQSVLRGGALSLSETGATDLSGVSVEHLREDAGTLADIGSAAGPVYVFDWFRVNVDYGAAGPEIAGGVARTVTVRLQNTYKVQAWVSVQWHAPEEWVIGPSRSGRVQSMPSNLGGSNELTFTIEMETVSSALNRAVVELTVNGYSTVMLVPIVLTQAPLG